ncbi:conserved phage C-terminal domain-containing protein [Bacillus sp. 3255]|uniref:conserved phage C-terminal domain-containing protein n=1 Tax=Bacillus sp. 3255 TaxID=2817904 RepID=UPI00285CDC8A|nr:conserved phage C-terminal domain-containing protein [Bacillus sp. 3255]MDR6884882.1 phage replication O-like protein O [Bacillus sp. 3255]
MSKLEEKYTRIANNILEAMMKNKFSPSQFRIIHAVWRYTYGFQRKDHEFAVSFLAEATEIDERKVKAELKSLIDNKVLIVTRPQTNKFPRKIGFNKHTEEWKLPERSVVEVTKTTPQQNSWGDDFITSGGDENNTSGGDDFVTQEKKGLKKISKESKTLIYEKVINYLNEKTGKKYSHKSKANISLLSGRLEEGRTFEDFIHVIDVKVNHWINDSKWKEYLRPSTLFNATNFENYMNQTMVNPYKPDSKNQHEMDILEQFYREGEALETNGNGEVSGGNKNLLP